MCKLVLVVQCVTVTNVVFMEGTERQCSESRLVLYCVDVCILAIGFECVTVSNDVIITGTADSAMWQDKCCVF